MTDKSKVLCEIQSSGYTGQFSINHTKICTQMDVFTGEAENRKIQRYFEAAYAYSVQEGMAIALPDLFTYIPENSTVTVRTHIDQLIKWYTGQNKMNLLTVRVAILEAREIALKRNLDVLFRKYRFPPSTRPLEHKYKEQFEISLKRRKDKEDYLRQSNP